MRFRVVGMLLAGGFAAVALIAAQTQDFSKVQIGSEQLAPGVYMLTGGGGNIALSVGEDAAFIVDDQYAPVTDKISAAIAKLTDKPVRFVINTHWHGDHTGGNENFGKAGAAIVAHDNVRRRMSTEQVNDFFKSKTPASPRLALPVVTFADSVTLHLNGDTVRTMHVPSAHTDGDAIIHFEKANVLHMGDLYFNGMYPFIDAQSGGSVDGVIAAAEKALTMGNAETKIIPGHGPLGNRAALTEYRDMLKAARDRITTLVKSGRSLAQIQAEQPLKDLDAKWGNGFLKPDQFLAMLHGVISKAARPAA
jgi:cyclase